MGDKMFKNKIIGLFCMVLGSLWLLGCIYGIYVGVLTAIELGAMEIAFGSVVGSGVVGVLGFFSFKYGYKKIIIR